MTPTPWILHKTIYYCHSQVAPCISRDLPRPSSTKCICSLRKEAFGYTHPCNLSMIIITRVSDFPSMFVFAPHFHSFWFLLLHELHVGMWFTCFWLVHVTCLCVKSNIQWPFTLDNWNSVEPGRQICSLQNLQPLCQIHWWGNTMWFLHQHNGGGKLQEWNRNGNYSIRWHNG